LNAKSTAFVAKRLFIVGIAPRPNKEKAPILQQEINANRQRKQTVITRKETVTIQKQTAIT
jgi:hypothetical protein